MRACSVRETSPGDLPNTATGEPFSFADACVSRGATAAYQAEAAQDVVKEIQSFLLSLTR